MRYKSHLLVLAVSLVPAGASLQLMVCNNHITLSSRCFFFLRVDRSTKATFSLIALEGQQFPHIPSKFFSTYIYSPFFG